MVDELSSLGLTSEVLQELLADSAATSESDEQDTEGSRPGHSDLRRHESDLESTLRQRPSSSKPRKNINAVARYELTGLYLSCLCTFLAVHS